MSNINKGNRASQIVIPSPTLLSITSGISSAIAGASSVQSVYTSDQSPPNSVSVSPSISWIASLAVCKGIFIFPFPFVSAVFYTCLLSRVWVSGVLLLTHFIVVIS